MTCRHPAVVVALIITSLAVSGCSCGRDSGLAKTLAELGVVWNGPEGVEQVSRDATFDFGTVRMGDRIGLSLVVRNLGGGPLTLSSIERITVPPEGAAVTLGEDVAPDAAFEVRFVPGTT